MRSSSSLPHAPVNGSRCGLLACGNGVRVGLYKFFFYLSTVALRFTFFPKMHLMWGTVGQGAFFVSHLLVLRALGSRSARASCDARVSGHKNCVVRKYTAAKRKILNNIEGQSPACQVPMSAASPRHWHRTRTAEIRAHTARHIAYRSVIHRTAVLILPVRCVQPQLRQGRDEPRRVRPPDEWVVDGGGAVRGPKKAVDEGGYREADR